MRKLNIFGYKTEIIPTIFVLISTCILISLGTWQLKRLDYKNNLIFSIEQNLKNPAIKISEIWNQDSLEGKEPEKKTRCKNHNLYKKIFITGHFLNDQNIFVYGRRSAYPEKDGYYLFSIFQGLDDKKYMVSRGWLKYSDKEKASEIRYGNHLVTIEALTMAGEKSKILIPKNDVKAGIWFTIDLQEGKELGYNNVTDFYLLEINSIILPQMLLPMRTDRLAHIRNDHLEYAITWYSLAAFLIIMFLIYNRKNSDK